MDYVLEHALTWFVFSSDTDKKLLVTSLQQAHNWTAKHDRNKMSFWFDVLFDEDEAAFGGHEEGLGDGSGFRPDVAKQQVQHWLDRNSRMCDTARYLLKDYAENYADKPPGNLAPIRPLAWNWLPEGSVNMPGDPEDSNEKINPVWKPDETDKYEQDKAYGRVSREIDTWWLRARDPNYEEWVVSMPTVELAQSRTEHCKTNLIHRYAHSFREDHSPPPEVADDELSDHEHCHHCPECHECHHHHDDDEDEEHDHEHDHDHEHEHECDHHHDHDHDHEHDHEQEHDVDCEHHHHHHHHHDHDHDHSHDHDYAHDYVDDMIDDEDADDDESYGDGPLTGLLTEVPNILDPKQIEALHMIVKSCILDNAGSGLTRAGENLQKTRCRMFLALDCGKSLLRELLVFIAVWDKDEQSLIFQVTTQIVEALHHSALIPYAWNSLRLPKDIISPAQTVLLRLVSHMFRARVNNSSNSNSSGSNNNNNPTSSANTANATTAGGNNNPSQDKDNSRDVKLVHFFFSYFRSRIVPECAALMHLQAQIREEKSDAADFPVDSWDMERAKDGLAQYLDFLTTVAEMSDTRAKLIEWEAIYDLIAVLSGLEAGVAKKPLIELPKRSPAKPDASPPPAASYTTPTVATNPMVERPYATEPASTSPSPPPPAYKFPWPGVKGQIFTILATLLQPPPGQSSPGNSQVQSQMVKYNGIVPLLNSCAYDDHNPFAKERVTICLKWLLDGCEAANNFFRELVSMAPQPNLKPTSGGTAVSTLRVDGIQGDIKVQVRSRTAPPVGREGIVEEIGDDDNGDLLERAAEMSLNSAPATSRGSIEDDFMA